ncbi:BREX system P-loop protein BrxC [Brevibacillus marinus]|uniref:BREX system P-loop protein BrxC n=1 Tax=Brevibacillus marinus TaxID=2496837 RepID=UPI000F845DAB|nr:BREX system P-loop protein BrxC [Brevibacillus marinus]
MKIFEALDRDPRTSSLANEGQARITETRDDRAIRELRSELETFVCDGQYGDAIERILQSYLTQLDRPRQHAAWVSGFFGSGKSHLLKMLGHLWVDTPFEDGSTARSLVPQLPDEIVALLRELDTQVARSGKPAIAAAGTLPSGSGDHVRLTVLSIILRACGLPEQYPQAQFCLWLRDQGYLEQVRSAVETAGKSWIQELNSLYVSPLIAQAVLFCDPNFASDERQARQVLREQFPMRTTDISTAEFIETARMALAPDGELPLTVLILDEVQQYIGDSTDRAVIFTEIAEAIQTQMDSRVMLVASGQSALSATPLLQKLRDRFRINVQLSDTDVEAVTRKVLLRKKPSATEHVRNAFERNAGEISKHLQGTRLAERSEDWQIIIEDYPLLPTRRRFWEECFRAVDAAGSHSQLRSQLRILNDSLKDIAESDLGTVIPADKLFEAIAPDLVSTGVLLNEIYTRIQELDDGSNEGRLKKRLCGLIFLINKLPREAGVDVGVRATANILADLLVEDLDTDSGPLRKRVETFLESLVNDGKLMKVGDEYRIQTTEGTEWERAFRERIAAWRQKEVEIASKRDQLLASAVQKIVSEIRLMHGESKIRRTLMLHARVDEPPATNDQIVIWMRDGWSTSLKDVENEARRRGQDDPVIHIFIPRASDDLQSRIIEAEAAQQVLDSKGVPSTLEGLEARESMTSRLLSAQSARDELIREVVTSAKVFQGGGNEIYGDSLKSKIETAAQASLARLFLRFAEGDHRAWETALRRAREGSDQPFSIVGWDQSTEDHPVAREVMAVVGSGLKGSEVRKTLKGAPYGWPQDAIDAALVALHRAGLLRATLNGQPVQPGQLDQNRIPSTEFRPEKIRLGTMDKIELRGLYQKAGVSVRSGEEELKANQFLETLLELARAAGGDPPLPARPDTRKIEELKRLTGTEQLGAILQVKTVLEKWIDEWTILKKRAEKRLSGWMMLERLIAHAETLSVAAEVRPDMEAIRSERSLLGDTDHVPPIRTKVATVLRAALTEQFNAMRKAWDEGVKTLQGDTSWAALDDNTRNDILNRVGLRAPVEPLIRSDEDLLRELDRQPLAARADAVAAMPERIAQALEEAARKLKPKAQRVSLRPATLETEDEVKAWLAEHERKLLEAIKQGPVIIG